jgi:hypothetical protein
LFLLLLVVRVVDFIVLTVVAMDIWKREEESSGPPFFTGYWWYWFCRI